MNIFISSCGNFVFNIDEIASIVYFKDVASNLFVFKVSIKNSDGYNVVEARIGRELISFIKERTK